MNEIRDAKFFGARIGDKCWFKDCEYNIYGVVEYKKHFDVYLCDDTNNLQSLRDGEGITFEPPKKKVKKEIDCYVFENKCPELEKYSIFWSKEQFCPEYRDNLIPAKLTFETWE